MSAKPNFLIECKVIDTAEDNNPNYSPTWRKVYTRHFANARDAIAHCNELDELYTLDGVNSEYIIHRAKRIQKEACGK